MLLFGLHKEGHPVVKCCFNLYTIQVLNKFLQRNGTGNCVEGVINSRTGKGPVRSRSCEIPYNTFKIVSWNIGTMRDRTSEIVETIRRKNIDLCCCKRSGGEVLRQDL